MDLAIGYYDRELLIDSISFNAHFLEMATTCEVITEEMYMLYLEIRSQLKEWAARDYQNNSTIDWVNDVANTFEKTKILPQVN